MLRLAILFPVVKVCDSLQPMAVLEVFPPFFRVANANMMPSSEALALLYDVLIR